MRPLRIAIALAALATAAVCQSFEVASIKPSPPGSQRGSSGGPGSPDPLLYTFHAATLNDLIAVAWHVDYFQIAARTPLDRQIFDLDARLPEGTTRDQFRAMLRNLLAERFHLHHHLETRDFPGFELGLSRGGSKLDPPAAPAPGFPELPPDRPGMASHQTVRDGWLLVRMRARQEPISLLAEWLVSDSQPVLDKTGLTGKYDFTLEFARPLPNAHDSAAEPPAADRFTALRQQLGLQLVPKKIPLPVVVVESVDKMPTDN